MLCPGASTGGDRFVFARMRRLSICGEPTCMPPCAGASVGGADCALSLPGACFGNSAREMPDVGCDPREPRLLSHDRGIKKDCDREQEAG